MVPSAGDPWGGDDPAGVRRNPFATRYVASARLASRDAGGRRLDVDALARVLVRQRCHGAIVGSHGSGKSTLLEQVANRLEAGHRRVLRLRVRAAADGVAVIMAISAAPSGTVVCIDGWEGLGWARAIVASVARLRGNGLLVTSHRRGCLKTVVECRTSVALLAALVSDLPGHGDWFGRDITWSDLEASFRATDGDLRTAMGMLYDLFERRVRGSADSP